MSHDASETIVELDPELVDDTFGSDRLPVDYDPEFESLKAAIADYGQLQPVLVRPHASASGRFEIAFGRRRMRVARELGCRVKAIVRPPKLSHGRQVDTRGGIVTTVSPCHRCSSQGPSRWRITSVLRSALWQRRWCP